jgi:hypothetical protein
LWARIREVLVERREAWQRCQCGCSWRALHSGIVVIGNHIRNVFPFHLIVVIVVFRAGTACWWDLPVRIASFETEGIVAACLERLHNISGCENLVANGFEQETEVCLVDMKTLLREFFDEASILLLHHAEDDNVKGLAEMGRVGNKTKWENLNNKISIGSQGGLKQC